MSDERIKAWSYSRLVDFEQCKLRAKLKYIDRIPEPARPLPPGKTEHANDRGTRIHDAGERFVRGGVELIPELKAFEAEFHDLRNKYEHGMVSLEGEWAVNKDWEPVAWGDKDAWARIKLDAFVRLSKTHAVVIDYKTGRKFGNEIKHAEQVQLYAVALMLRHPELTDVDVELWYLDQDDLTHDAKPVTKWIRHLKPFNSRFMRMSIEKKFKPNPNKFSCKWCPYKGNACKFGVV